MATLTGLRSIGLLGACLTLDVACGGRPVREEIPSSRAEVVTSPRAEDPPTYAYVAKRTRAFVGLAEARNIPPNVARDAVDRLADGLESCVREEERRGAAVSGGAVRVAARVDDRGAVRDTAVRISPEPGVAKVAALCLVVPIRTMAFPPGDASDRGFAVEALWSARPQLAIP
jgi:hypothetical protein